MWGHRRSPVRSRLEPAVLRDFTFLFPPADDHALVHFPWQDKRRRLMCRLSMTTKGPKPLAFLPRNGRSPRANVQRRRLSYSRPMESGEATAHALLHLSLLPPSPYPSIFLIVLHFDFRSKSLNDSLLYRVNSRLFPSLHSPRAKAWLPILSTMTTPP